MCACALHAYKIRSLGEFSVTLTDPFKPSALGYKFVLTVTVYFSKYVEAIPIPDKSADSVAKEIYKIY